MAVHSHIMPGQRPPVTTQVLDDAGRNQVKRSIREEVARGRQASIVGPFIDPNPDSKLMLPPSGFPCCATGSFPT